MRRFNSSTPAIAARSVHTVGMAERGLVRRIEDVESSACVPKTQVPTLHECDVLELSRTPTRAATATCSTAPSMRRCHGRLLLSVSSLGGRIRKGASVDITKKRATCDLLTARHGTLPVNMTAIQNP